jgi:hypothetical protein
MAEIQLNEHGFAVLRVWVQHRDSSVMSYLPYKVDTGANRTTINQKQLHLLGYNDDWIRGGYKLTGLERPEVATGKRIDNCYRVVLPEIRVGVWRGINWPFLVSLDDQVQFRLLFGTDSMQFFKWELDYERMTCGYEAVQGKRVLLFNQTEQSVHALDAVP